jgi:hypothetical protein
MTTDKRFAAKGLVQAEGFGETNPGEDANDLHEHKRDEESDDLPHGLSQFDDVRFVVRNEVKISGHESHGQPEEDGLGH